MSTPRIPEGQDWFTAAMIAYGLDSNNRAGICHGITNYMMVLAFTLYELNKEDPKRARKTITDLFEKTGSLFESIHARTEQKSEVSPPNEDERILLEMVSLFQASTNEYDILFPKNRYYLVYSEFEPTLHTIDLLPGNSRFIYLITKSNKLYHIKRNEPYDIQNIDISNDALTQLKKEFSALEPVKSGTHIIKRLKIKDLETIHAITKYQWEENEPGYYSQGNVSKVLSIVVPAAIKEAGITNIAVFSGNYSLKELPDYFSSLELEMSNANFPIILVLSNSVHSIFVAYFPEIKTWLFLDSFDILSLRVVQRGELEKKVATPFNQLDEDENNPKNSQNIQTPITSETRFIFSSTFYVLSKDASQALQCVTNLKNNPAWNQIHQVTEERAHQTDINHASWLLVASIVGDNDIVKQLSNIYDINNVDLHGYSPFI